MTAFFVAYILVLVVIGYIHRPSASHEERWLKAGNPSTPPDALSILMRDEDPFIRMRVASNPNTHTDVLTALSKDDINGVRRSAVKNPNTQPEILASSSKDEDSWVRMLVARNPSTPYGIWIPRFGRVLP